MKLLVTLLTIFFVDLSNNDAFADDAKNLACARFTENSEVESYCRRKAKNADHAKACLQIPKNLTKEDSNTYEKIANPEMVKLCLDKTNSEERVKTCSDLFPKDWGLEICFKSKHIDSALRYCVEEAGGLTYTDSNASQFKKRFLDRFEPCMKRTKGKKHYCDVFISDRKQKRICKDSDLGEDETQLCLKAYDENSDREQCLRKGTTFMAYCENLNRGTEVRNACVNTIEDTVLSNGCLQVFEKPSSVLKCFNSKYGATRLAQCRAITGSFADKYNKEDKDKKMLECISKKGHYCDAITPNKNGRKICKKYDRGADYTDACFKMSRNPLVIEDCLKDKKLGVARMEICATNYNYSTYSMQLCIGTTFTTGFLSICSEAAGEKITDPSRKFDKERYFDSLENCLNFGHNEEVIRSCLDTFDHHYDKNACIKHAKNPEVVIECSNIASSSRTVSICLENGNLGRIRSCKLEDTPIKIRKCLEYEI